MRGFFSGFGKGTTVSPFSKDARKMPVSLAKAQMKQYLKNGGNYQETPEEKQKKLIKAKIDKIMTQVIMGDNSNKFTPKGSKLPEKKLSKTTLKLLEQIAATKVRKQNLIDSRRVIVKKKHYENGGRIEADGKIYNRENKVVGKVELKTGIVKNSYGFSIGKYKDTYLFHWKIYNLIAKGITPKKIVATKPPVTVWSEPENGSTWW